VLRLLDEAGRLQIVTLPSLRAKGADRFCWIGAGEEFISISEQEKRLTPSQVGQGGFIYVFSDGSEPLYFPLSTSAK
jgi:hypothetical protein